MLSSKIDFILLVFLALCLAEVTYAQEKNPATSPEDHLISMDNPKKVSKSTISVDASAADRFGETLSKQLKNAKYVSAYKLSNFVAQQGDEAELMEQFPILERRKIDLEKQQAIADLLISDQPYLEDRHMKNLCIFLPDMAFVFETDERPVNALVSLDCKMVRFYFQEAVNDNRFIELNTKMSYQQFDQIYDELFGQSLKMNNKNSAKSTSAKVNKNCSTQENELLYTVQRGQGLSHVAKKASKQFDQKITVKDICALNGINTQSIIRTGQELIVGCLN